MGMLNNSREVFIIILLITIIIIDVIKHHQVLSNKEILYALPTFRLDLMDWICELCLAHCRPYQGPCKFPNPYHFIYKFPYPYLLFSKIVAFVVC
jgi:hypothetical protein